MNIAAITTLAFLLSTNVSPTVLPPKRDTPPTPTPKDSNQDSENVPTTRTSDDASQNPHQNSVHHEKRPTSPRSTSTNTAPTQYPADPNPIITNPSSVPAQPPNHITAHSSSSQHVEVTSPPPIQQNVEQNSTQTFPKVRAQAPMANEQFDYRHFRQHQRKRLALLREPVFNGIGLLIGAGTSAAVVLGSGIALTALSRETHEVCDIYLGEPDCYREPKYYEWLAFSGTMFTLGTLAATSIGISGGVLLGRYDAWRVYNKKRKPVKGRTHLAVGSSLLGLSATLLAASLTSSFSSDDDVYEIGVPLFGTLGVLSAASGLTMVSYGASYLLRSNRLKHISAAPLIQRRSRSAGIAITGRF